MSINANGLGFGAILMTTALFGPAMAPAQSGPTRATPSEGSPTTAVEPATPAEEPASEGMPPGEIVAAATRRRTTLQRTPISMTAMSGDALREQGATNIGINFAGRF